MIRIFANQITCHNTGQIFNDGHSGTNDADIDAPGAWEVTRGCSDVVIAVLDEGVTSNHPDLPNTRQIRLNGSNFGTGDANDPSPINDENHGNACAGVIAATMNNNQGIAGIAPGCRIMPVRIAGGTPEDLADAIVFAVDNGADILSNSWGYPTANNYAHPVIITALTYAINAEVLIFFAAGNEADHASGDNGYVTFPANSSIVQIITVGASDRDDSQANYSPTSNLIDIVAPSHRAYPWQITGETLEMYTIDIPGNDGYNPWPNDPDLPNPPTIGEILPNNGTNNLSYTGRFGGTSHACPVVAGVAALVLSMDPTLTPEEVFTILRNTADDVGGYSYSNGRCNEMGHGRVNANSAVREVLNQFTVTGPNVVCYSNTTFTASNSPTCSTIDWTTSSNLKVVSGDNTLTPSISAKYSSSQGEGWVQINYALDGNTTPGPRQNVWVGKPQDFQEIDVWEYSSHQTLLCPSSNQYKLHVVIPNDLARNAINDYDWELLDGGGITWPYYVDGSNPLPIETSSDFTFARIGVYLHNTCGWSDYPYYNYFTQAYNCGGYYMSFSPNPTTGETTLSIEHGELEETKLKSASTQEFFDDNAEWNMEIYSPMQTIKEKKTKLKGKSTTIQTTGWMEGIYTVRVKYKDQILTEKLVVKK